MGYAYLVACLTGRSGQRRKTLERIFSHARDHLDQLWRKIPNQTDPWHDGWVDLETAVQVRRTRVTSSPRSIAASSTHKIRNSRLAC